MPKLQELYPEQFRGSYYLGTSIGSGWLPVVERALARVRDALTPDEINHFAWAQIKEKFGHLCMYRHSSAVPVSIISSAGVFNFEVDITATEDNEEAPGSAQSGSSQASIQANIDAKVTPIIAMAEREAAHTCETCGETGRLYDGSWWVTLCDQHAIENNKSFPPNYGTRVQGHGSEHVIDGIQARANELVWFPGTRGVLWRFEDDPERSCIDMLDLPTALVAMVEAAGEPLFKRTLGLATYCDFAQVESFLANPGPHNAAQVKKLLQLPKGAKQRESKHEE